MACQKQSSVKHRNSSYQATEYITYNQKMQENVKKKTNRQAYQLQGSIMLRHRQHEFLIPDWIQIAFDYSGLNSLVSSENNHHPVNYIGLSKVI